MSATRTSIRRRGWRTLPIGVVAVLVAGLAATACSSSGGSSEPTLTLYNAQHEQTTDSLVAAFTKQTGIKVRVENDDEDVLTAQLEQEGSKSRADVFYTENSNWLEQLNDKGLLAKVDSGTLASVPTADSASNGRWVGVSARISVLVYNPSKISAAQLPTSVMEMADPKYKGEFELAPAETDFWPIVSSVAKTHGNAAALTWLEGLKANAGANDNVPDNETLTSDVARGTTSFAIINHYYFYRLRAEQGAGSFDAKLSYFAPRDPGYIQNISGVGVLKSSTHQKEAQELVAFMTSAAGQRILAKSESFEYPIHPGVAANPQLAPLAQLQPAPFTPADLGTGLNAKALLQQAGLL